MDIETILKETGMTEGELISYVNEMSNQGFTSDEIYKSLMQPVMDKKVETNKQRNLFKQITGISDDSLLGKMMPSVQIPMKTEAQRKADFPQGLDLLSYGVTPKEPEASVVEEEVEDDPDWKHHTDPEGNSKPGDNGLTDLKRFGSWVGNGIGDTFKNAADYDNSMNQDLLRDLGMVYKLGLGDNSILQMWNQNEQAELARKQQQEYNDYWKRVELAAEQKEKDATAAKEKAEQDKVTAAERKEAIDVADNLEAEIMDKSGQGADFTGITEVQKNKFQKAIEKVAEKGGDTSKYDVVAKALGLLETETDESESVETVVETKPAADETVVETKPAKKEDKPKVNLVELKTESDNIVSIKPTDVSWDNRNAVAAYNKNAKLFNAKLNKLGVSSTNMPRLPLITLPVNPATVKSRDNAIDKALKKQDEAEEITGIHNKLAAGSSITPDEWNKVKSKYDRKSPSAYNELSEDEKQKYKKAGPWYYKKK